MIVNGVTLLLALVAVCLAIFLVRLSARARRRGKRIKGHSRADRLADLTDSSVDPDWEATRQTMPGVAKDITDNEGKRNAS